MPEKTRQKISNHLSWLCLQKELKGFTLVELLVVVMFITGLTLISLPNFLGQVGKSREAEVAMKLGAIARSQQGYHFQKGEFAATMEQLKFNSGFMTSPYYTFPDPQADSSKVKHQAVPIDPEYAVRYHSIGIYFNQGAYGRSTCRGFSVGDIVNVGDTPDAPCIGTGEKIQ
jgi:type IV pilus assembly protein PilA